MRRSKRRRSQAFEGDVKTLTREGPGGSKMGKPSNTSKPKRVSNNVKKSRTPKHCITFYGSSSHSKQEMTSASPDWLIPQQPALSDGWRVI